MSARRWVGWRKSWKGFGRHIRLLRDDQGMRSFAKQVGVSPATISRVERGFPPDLYTFGRLCRSLGLSADHLMGIDP